MKNLVFFGIQGSGKGTQSLLIAEKTGGVIFETGAQLREIAALESNLGKKVKETIEKGNLVTNEIVMKVLENFVKEYKNKRIIFDGIPRSWKQKETFDQLLKQENIPFLGILIDISEEEAKKRLLGRKICIQCKKVFPANFLENKCSVCAGELKKRSDDNEKAILKRIENFSLETKPVIKKYQEEDKILVINGQQSVENVTKEILTKLGNKI